MDAPIERRFRAVPEDRLAGLLATFAAKKAGGYVAKKLGQKYGGQAIDLLSKNPTGAAVVDILDKGGALKKLGIRTPGLKDRLIAKLDEDIDLGGGIKVKAANLAGWNLGAALQPDFDLGKEDEPFRGTLLRYGERTKMPGFDETFESRAFGDVAGQDVTANLFHRRDRPIARTDGGGLTLEEDGDEIRALIELPPTRDGEDAAILIERRVIRGLSVEFRAAQETWEGNLRRIQTAELLGLGLVDSPQYTGSQISQRALERAAGREYVTERDCTIWL